MIRQEYLTEKQQQMIEAPLNKLLAKLAAPAIFSQLISILYNTVDTYLVSHIGTVATAAVGIMYSLSLIINALSYGPAAGTSSLISRCIGAGKNDEANKYTVSSIFLSINLGLLLMVIYFTNPRGFIRLMGATEDIENYAMAYGKWIAITAPVMCGEIVMSMSLRAEGTSLSTTVALCIGGITKISVEPLLIKDYGIEGASLATFIGESVSFVLLLFIYLSGRSIIKLNIRKISRNINDYLIIMETGIPSVARQGAGTVASVFTNWAAAGYGTALIAAFSIQNKIYLFCRSTLIGLGHGYQAIAGYNYGAGKLDRVRKIFKRATIIGTIICIAFAIIIFMWSEEIIRFFRDDPAVISNGLVMLKAMTPALPMMAYSTFVNQLYQCLGFSGKAAFLAGSRQAIFFIPIIMIFTRLWGKFGIQIAQPCSDTFTFFISIPFQIAFFKNQLILDDEEKRAIA